jgi:hypothetical protein
LITLERTPQNSNNCNQIGVEPGFKSLHQKMP